MSMPVLTLTSSSKTDFSNPPEISKNVREASFSSYLDGVEEAFVLKLGGARTQGLSSSLSTAHDHILLRKTRTDDREIDVFDAEKYFKEELNHSPKVGTKNSLNHHHKKDDPIEIFAIKEQPPIAALSIHSESSWNSRSALLHAISRNQKPRKANKKSFLATFGCNCSCIDNNSTDVDECIGENSTIKSASIDTVNGKPRKGDETSDHFVRKSESDYNSMKLDEPTLRENSNGRFSFPVYKNQPEIKVLQVKDDSENRKSLEIFGSIVLENGKNSFNIEKNVTMMAWDAVVPEEIKIPSICSEIHNDSDSDASSDLFEIESLSKGNPFLSRQASDALSGYITPTTCYAPSEASIEWSVITASAADCSILSDSEDVTSNITIPCPKKAGVNSKISPLKEIPKLRPSILSGCKNHKAVNVAGDAHKARNHVRGGLLVPMTRFHEESDKSFGVKNRQPSFDARVISLPRPGNATHLLYA